MNRSYPELGISLTAGDGRDTTTDRVVVSDAGVQLTIENDLRHEPDGIETVAATLGIKNQKKVDFTVMRLKAPQAAAAVFTTCRCPSYTVIRNRRVLAGGAVQAIAVNSGNANVYTPSGDADLGRCAELIAAEFRVEASQLFVCSTGVIGVRLPVERFEAGVPGLAAKLQPRRLDDAAKAILTTDLGPKTASARDGDLVVCGIAKGAGMIEPHLATMLVYLFTNAKLEHRELQELLEDAVRVSFNSISIDTDTSTSDSVSLLSTGEVPVEGEQHSRLAAMLKGVCVKLARDIVSQGEGVTKTIECTVSGDLPVAVCRRLAKQIINSPLVKTAVHGADPNWGRVVAALGKPQADVVEPLFAESDVRIEFAGEAVFDGGRPVAFDLAGIRQRMASAKCVPIDVRLGSAPATVARVWGCDLTEEYVTFNSDYTS